MSPEAPKIPEPPLGPPKLELVPPLPEQITIPEDIQASINTRRAEQEQATVEQAENTPVISEPPVVETAPASDNSGVDEAEAAKRVIGMPPGYEAPVVEAQTPDATSKEEDKGKFGMGVIPVDMPADPSHVVGWEGEVRR